MISQNFLRRGFTIVELLIVIAILGSLATVVLISSAGGSTKRARDTIRKAETKQIQNLFSTYLVTYRNFRNITGTPAASCADGDGKLAVVGGQSFCQVIYYSNNSAPKIGIKGHYAWSKFKNDFASIARSLPNDPKNNYSDWAHYPGSVAVCSSGCDVNSPITDGYYLVGIASQPVSNVLCGTPITLEWFIQTALEDENDPHTLVNRGYSCINVGKLKHLKAEWGTL